MKEWIGICVVALGLSCQSSSQAPQVTLGKLTYTKSFKSKIIDSRPIAIWTSPNFDPNKEHITLYMHDGQMLFDANTTWNQQEWEVDEHLSHLISENHTPAFVVVGIYNNGPKRHSEYFPQKPFENLPLFFQDSIYKETLRGPQQPLFNGKIYSDDYLRFIVTELKPFVEDLYGKTEPQHTWIGGASMGGLISWYALNEYPEVFGKALCFSTHWPGVWPQDDPKKKVLNAFLDYQKNHLSQENQHWYFDHGDQTLDQYYLPYQLAMNEAMNKTAIHYLSYPGTDHSEKSWSAHFEKAIKLLLTQ